MDNTIFVSLVKMSPVSLENKSVSLSKDPEIACQDDYVLIFVHVLTV